jgi:ubiquinol-cytochrome c reductase cytochrome c1 subunit
MKKLFLIVSLLVLAPSVTLAASSDVKLDKVKINLNDKKSLQRGARIFVNYCLSCHSAGYMRYSRLGEDLGISEELVQENLLFAADKVGDLMKAVMPKEDAMAAFGTVPPDLTLTARSRGPEWIYTYMRSFYRDEKESSGWNNVVFPKVAMPHVLYEWQGQQRAIFEKDEHGVTHFKEFTLERPGTMSSKEYDAAMRDLTNFFVYLGEPAKLERYRLGVFVILFLLVLAVLSWLLKKEYWKDVK